jgi:ectoine hydroxylase-related dioxygenase (phytanoyl-CoA dioxygenase family)
MVRIAVQGAQTEGILLSTVSAKGSAASVIPEEPKGLCHEQVDTFQRNGYLLVPDLLTPAEIACVETSLNEIRNWPEECGKWMHYYERIGGQPVLCRTENFSPFHQRVRDIICSPKVLTAISQLLEDEAAIFKEKVNYKAPGGGGKLLLSDFAYKVHRPTLAVVGFPPHQDAPAYTQLGVAFHVTMMIAVDPMTIDNGPLEVIPKSHLEGVLPQNSEDGTIADSWIIRQPLAEAREAGMASPTSPWVRVTCPKGACLFFGSYIAHKSEENTSSTGRAAFYITYSNKKLGNLRDKYYAEKRRLFPPRAEKLPGVDYAEGARIYNLATPITE